MKKKKIYGRFIMTDALTGKEETITDDGSINTKQKVSDYIENHNHFFIEFKKMEKEDETINY
ncbi:hypothetical protein FACS1894110_24700 [Spirochaetia bacterium]|nr:hypothetical protein FACS1894110_24700 [Spirochaetia bacterium]